MEQKLGYPLDPNDDVHHKDGNPLNNDIDNLELINHSVHDSMHSIKYKDKIAVCCFCKKEFLWTAKQQSQFAANRKRNNRLYGPFCSKSCAGSFGKQEQIRRNANAECE